MINMLIQPIAGILKYLVQFLISKPPLNIMLHVYYNTVLHVSGGLILDIRLNISRYLQLAITVS